MHEDRITRWAVWILTPLVALHWAAELFGWGIQDAAGTAFSIAMWIVGGVWLLAVVRRSRGRRHSLLALLIIPFSLGVGALADALGAPTAVWLVIVGAGLFAGLAAYSLIALASEDETPTQSSPADPRSRPRA